MIKSTNISINEVPVLLKENKNIPTYDYQRPMGRGEPQAKALQIHNLRGFYL